MSGALPTLGDVTDVNADRTPTAPTTEATGNQAAAPKRLMLIDGHSMAFRAFFGLPAENFSTTGGQHTNAVYGFLSMLVSLLNEEKPTHVAVAFDIGRKTFRTDRFPDYKAQRDATPPEFKGQVELLKEILQEMGLVSLDKENYEADDIIATLATQATGADFDTYIVTGDRDSFQLVNDTTTVLYPMRGVSNLHRFTPEAVEEKYGLTPQQYPDYAALRGDPSDNLPGIPGVGQKTAEKWIVNYGSLDELIKNADEIRGKVGKSLRERIDAVLLNRELTEMVKDLPLPYQPDELELRPANANGIARVLDSLQFGTNLRERIFAALNIADDAGDEPDPDARVAVVNAIVEGELDDWLSKHVAEQPAAVAVQGNPSPTDGDAVRVAICAPDGETAVLYLPELNAADEQTLNDFLSNPAQPKLFHGAKAVWHMLHARGVVVDGLQHDTAIAAYLLRPGQRTYELKDVLQRHLQRTLSAEAVDDGQLSLLETDEPDSTDVALANEAAAIYDLSETLVHELEAIEARELYERLELPLVFELAEMESVGIAVNQPALKELRDEFQDLLLQSEEEARSLVGKPDLNVSSPKQLQAVLFDELDMPKTKKTKTGYSTAAKELETLQASHPHPFLGAVLQYRENQKMKSTIEGLLDAVAADGRIHTTFNQTVAATGRLSSTDPNLQNIPVRTEAGHRIRATFVVGEGYETLLTADYSQIEMRVMAHLSGDAGLIDAYKRGEDLHNYVGSRVFNVGIDDVTPELRRRVKAMSYGLAYGLSAFGLAGQLGISGGEAKKLMEDYFDRFGGVREYLDRVVDQARRDGFTETLYGRRRYLPELTSTNRVARENAERAALNAPIQGTAADIIKVAMLRVQQQLDAKDLKSRILLQVHDELVVEVAAGEREEVEAILRAEMGSAIDLKVPLDVSVGAGENWDSAAH